MIFEASIFRVVSIIQTFLGLGLNVGCNFIQDLLLKIFVRFAHLFRVKLVPVLVERNVHLDDLADDREELAHEDNEEFVGGAKESREKITISNCWL